MTNRRKGVVRFRSLRSAAPVFALVVLAACGGGGGGGGESFNPAPEIVFPDLSGVWAGAWQGNDPTPGGLGLVSGTWEAEIHQFTSAASGPGVRGAIAADAMGSVASTALSATRTTVTLPPAGRAFVRLYYRYSPPLADMIRDHDGARAVVRSVLRPMVWSMVHPGNAFAIFLLVIFVAGALRVRRRHAARNAPAFSTP